MTNTNTHNETTSIGHNESHGVIETTFNLPADVPTLTAMRVAIDKKIAELKTSGAETLRSLILQESAALGMDPHEVLDGKPGKKPRGGKRSKE